MTATFPIDNIKIGTRHRRDMGDIAQLAAEIAVNGLLHPVVVHNDGRLVAGARRLAAVKLLGWQVIPVTFSEVDTVKGEASENFARKDFSLSEAVAIKRELEPQAKREARERQAQAGGSAPGKLPEAVKTGEARDRVAAAAGFGARTLAKAAAIVEAAEAEPEKFAKLKADMDRTGKADGVFKRLVVARKAEATLREPPPLPKRGPYRVIVCDPPWQYDARDEDASHRAAGPYPRMTISQICNVDVQSIAHDDSIVWLWTTNSHMREAYTVLDAWAFQAKTILTWFKTNNFGCGRWLTPKGAHSEKPEAFYRLVESLCPAPRYCELFARRKRPGWDGHGDEVAEAAE